MKLSDYRRRHMVEVDASIHEIAYNVHFSRLYHGGAEWRSRVARILQAADHLREHIAAVDAADTMIASLGPDHDLPEPTDGPQPTTSPAPSQPIRATTSAPAER